MRCQRRRLFVLVFITFFVVILYPAPTHAGWIFDTTVPSCGVSPIASGANTVQLGFHAFTVWASDLAGIASLSVSNTTPLPTPLPAPVTSPATCPYGSCTYQTQTYNWTTPPPIGSYNLAITAIDNAGNPGTATSCPPFSFTITNTFQPWLKTTGGDVHSNTGISASGGP